VQRRNFLWNGKEKGGFIVALRHTMERRASPPGHQANSQE